MNFWEKYKTKVNNNFDLLNENADSINHWKNILFANTVIYILPLSLIALIPGLVYSWNIANYGIFIFDLIALLMLLTLGFVPGIRIDIRKTFFIGIIYIIATFFLFVIGPLGPGMIYLLSTTFFCVIIFPNKYSYYPAIANLVICLLILILIPYSVLPWSGEPYHNINYWMATSSNLILLSFITSLIFPPIFNGLKKAIEKEKKSKLELDKINLELIETLEELKNKNSDLEAFAFSASHDLQEPLRMVSSFLTQLQKKYADRLDDKANQYIYFAVDGAKRMRQIIMDLLEYSRVGRFDGKKEWIDCSELVNQVKSLNNKLIAEKSVIITSNNLPKVYGHSTPLHQVFQNLINNAIKYGKNGISPIINIEGEDAGQYWTFSIKDNGIGIKPEYFDKIFVIFQRLHGKNEYEGSGMGLSIVKKIIENLGGKIWVESEPEKGSTFIFTIPKKSVN